VRRRGGVLRRDPTLATARETSPLGYRACGRSPRAAAPRWMRRAYACTERHVASGCLGRDPRWSAASGPAVARGRGGGAARCGLRPPRRRLNLVAPQLSRIEAPPRLVDDRLLERRPPTACSGRAGSASPSAFSTPPAGRSIPSSTSGATATGSRRRSARRTSRAG